MFFSQLGGKGTDMEIHWGQTFFANLCGIDFLWILSSVFIFTLFAFLTHWIWKWRTFINKVRKLPSNKYRIYDVLGDISYTFQIRRMKSSLPPHVYDLQFTDAFHTLFMKEGIDILWVTFLPMVNVFKADWIEAILNNSTDVKKAYYYKCFYPWVGDGLFTSAGQKWRNRRKLLTQSFHFNILRDFLPIINKQARILCDILGRHSSEAFIDIVPYARRCSLDILCETILGADIQSQTEPNDPYAQSISILKNIVAERLYNAFLWPDFIFKYTPLGKKFFTHVKITHDFTNKLIREKKEKILNDLSHCKTEDGNTTERKASKRKAFLDLLLDEHINNNSISEEEIREEVDTFAFAGHDTTATALAWTLYLIGLHPVIQEKVHQELDSVVSGDRETTLEDLKEMKYLECVIKESLRLYPPAARFGRQLSQDVEVRGRVIPKGCTVTICASMLHRDPQVFPDPEKFDPQRFTPENSAGRHSFAYIPFSGGPRNCIGQRFAVMELKAIISTVLKKFKIRSLDPRDKIHTINEIVLIPVESIRIEFKPRNYEPEKPAIFYHP